MRDPIWRGTLVALNLTLALALGACGGKPAEPAAPSPTPAATPAPAPVVPPLVLTIETTPPGARCVGRGLLDGVETSFILEDTPGAMQLSPDARRHPVVCSLKGYRPETLDIQAKVPPNATDVTAAITLTKSDRAQASSTSQRAETATNPPIAMLNARSRQPRPRLWPITVPKSAQPWVELTPARAKTAAASAASASGSAPLA